MINEPLGLQQRVETGDSKEMRVEQVAGHL